MDHETGLASSSRAAASTGLNMSIHNDSSEDEELAHPMEGVATSAGRLACPLPMVGVACHLPMVGVACPLPMVGVSYEYVFHLH